METGLCLESRRCRGRRRSVGDEDDLATAQLCVWGKAEPTTYKKCLVQLLRKDNLLGLPDAELDQVVDVLEGGVQCVLGDGLVRLGSEAGEECVGAKCTAREFHGSRHC